MSLSDALADFFALLGPDSSEEAVTPSKLLATSKAQEHRIAELEKQKKNLEQRNKTLQELEDFRQEEIIECLNLADRLCPSLNSVVSRVEMERQLDEKERCWNATMTAVIKERDVHFAQEAAAWKMRYEAFGTQVAFVSAETQRKIGTVTDRLGRNVGEVERLERENAVLKHDISLMIEDHKKDRNTITRLEKELVSFKSRYEEQHYKTAQENYTVMLETRENAILNYEKVAEEKERLEQENRVLKLDLEQEKIHHQVALEVVKSIYEELEAYKLSYEQLYYDWKMLKDECYDLVQQNAEIDERRIDSIRKLNIVADELCKWKKVFQSQSTELENTVKKYVTLQRRCDKLAESIAAIKDAYRFLYVEKRVLNIDQDNLLKERNALLQKNEKLRARTVQLDERLFHSETDRDATVRKLEKALLQREEALEGQLEALKMVEKLKSGEVTLDGKEIIVLEEDEVVGNDDGKVQDTEAELSGESSEIALADELCGEEYSDCGQFEYEADIEYENVSGCNAI